MHWIVIGCGIVALLLSLVVVPLSIALSYRLQLLDEPGERKVHKQGTPRLGGIGIIGSSVVVGVPACVFVANHLESVDPDTVQQLLALLVGGLFVFAIGIVDDVYGVPSKFKLLGILAAACSVWGAGVEVNVLGQDRQILVETSWASGLIIILWITTVTTALNFIDGLDGLAGGLALLASLVITAFLLAAGDYLLAVPGFVLAGSILGFLRYNQHPAKTFMGDGGSMTLGFVLATLMMIANPVVGSMRALVLPSLALSVALLDVVVTVFRRRYLQRRSIFSAERGHIHHRLLDRGISHPHAVNAIHAVSLICVAIGVVSLGADGWLSVVSMALAPLVIWAFFSAAGSVRTNDMVGAVRRKRHIDRRSRQLRTAFETLQLQFDAVEDFSSWWRTVCAAAERMGFSRIELPVGPSGSGSQRTLEWMLDPDESEAMSSGEQIEARIPFKLHGELTPERHAKVHVPAEQGLESAGERLALFSRLLADHGQAALKRVHREHHPEQAATVARESGELGQIRIALVHDFFYVAGGAERVVEKIIETFGHCDVFGLFDFLPEHERGVLKGKSVRTSFIHWLPFARGRHRHYLPLMPLAIEQLDVSEYDVVISSSYLVAKGVITGPDQLHICYCHSPVRYGWDLQHQYLRQAKLGYGPRGMLARWILHYIRNWDARSSLGVDQFIANSRFVASRIMKVYRRESRVIHPPVDTSTFVPCARDAGPRQDYFLTVSRLVPYKRIDLIVEAFAKMPSRRLVVIGEGPEAERIRSVAGPNVEILGHRERADVVRYMQHARAFIFSAEEDFGIVPVEAMACGTPVVAYGKGGALDTIHDGVTGVFFNEQTTQALAKAVEHIDRLIADGKLDRDAIRSHAQRFSSERFVEQLTDLVRLQAQSKWPTRSLGSGAPVKPPHNKTRQQPSQESVAPAC